MYVHLWSLFLIAHTVREKLSQLLQYLTAAMRSLIEMMIINPMITMRTIAKYRLGQALVQLASDTVMFLGIIY